MTRAVGVRAESSGRSDSVDQERLGYFEQSERPLSSLLLLLPFIILYEVGTGSYAAAGYLAGGKQIIAFVLMQRFFHWFGASGQHLPALAVVGILLTWHIARNDRWQMRFGTLIGMLVESVLLAFPLIVLGRVMAHYFPLAAIDGSFSRVQDTLVMPVGAGVYEELIFRLILFSLLSLVLKDALGLRSTSLNVWIVVASALLFSAYHYLSPAERFNWHIFAFRSIAGAYFGAIFILRGFGITAASHSSYDVLISVL